MQRPFKKYLSCWLILFLLVTSQNGKAVESAFEHTFSSATASDDTILHATPYVAPWNVNCTFEEVAALMKGPDEDLIRFTVSSRTVSGVVPACVGLSGASVNFKYNGTTYSVDAGTPVDVILRATELGETATITDAAATFNCSDGTVANPPTSCEVISPGGFGSPFLVNGGTIADYTFSTSGGCSSGFGRFGAVFNKCAAVVIELNITYEKRRLALNLTDANFICQDIPSDEQGESFKPTISFETIGDISIPFMGNAYAFEVSNSLTGTYRTIRESDQGSGTFSYDDLVLSSESPGTRYVRVSDLSCSGRVSSPVQINAYPSVDVSFESVLGASLDDDITFEIDRSDFYDDVDLIYSIRQRPLGSRDPGAGTSFQYVFPAQSGSCLLTNSCIDIVDKSVVRIKANPSDPNLFGSFPPNFTYYIIADILEPGVEVAEACPRGQFFDIDVNPTVNISPVATLTGSTFNVCNGGTTIINGSFAKQGLDVGAMTIQRGSTTYTLANFKANQADGLELSIKDGSGLLTKINGSSMNLTGLNITAFRLENASAATYTFTPLDLGGNAFGYPEDEDYDDTKSEIQRIHEEYIASQQITITEAPAITVTQDGSTSHVRCPGGNDGSFTFTVSGGTGKDYVVRYGPAASQIITPSNGKYTLSGRTAGTYNIAVTDGGGCQILADVPFTIEQPNAYNAGADETIYVCKNTATISAPGLPSSNAAGTWSGTWTRSAGSGNIAGINDASTSVSNLQVGSNVFKWTAEVGSCTVKPSKTITVFYLEAVAKDAGVEQHIRTNTTSLNATAPGANEQGIWTRVAGSGNISNTSSRTSTVTSLSKNKNTFRWNITLNKTLQDPSCNTAKFLDTDIYYSDLAGSFVGKSNETCGNDGAITVTATGGIGAGFTNGKYAYTISPKPPAYASATIYGDAAVTFNNLPANTYTITVSNDEAGFDSKAIPIKFSATSNNFVISPNSNRLSVGVQNVLKDVACGDGSVEVGYANGVKTPTATLLRKSGATFTSVSVSPANLTITASKVTFVNIEQGGTYKISLTDDQCVSETNEFTIAGLSIAIGTVTSNAESKSMVGVVDYFNYCQSENAFNVTVPVSGVASIFKYELWKNGIRDLQQNNATSTANNAAIALSSLELDANYELRIFGTPSCGTSTSYQFRLVKPRPSVSVSQSRQSCFGVADASFSLTITGGVRPYSVRIGTGSIQTVPVGDVFTSTSFISGTFSYEITDANGCVWSSYPSVVVAPKNELFIKSASGGSPLTTYAIGCPGAGTNLVYKGEGGTGTFMPAKLINNRTLAERTANSVGGIFTFNNVIEDNTTYDLVITDTDGCPKTLSGIVVNDPDDLLAIEGVKSTPVCYGGDDGSFTVTGTGGTPNASGYQFSITNATGVNSLSSSTSSDFGTVLTGMFGITDPDPNVFRNSATFTRPAGTYTITIIDANNCPNNELQVTIDNPAEFMVDLVTPVAASCSEIEDGALNMTTSNGNSGTYTFELYSLVPGSSLPVFEQSKTSTDGTINFTGLSGDITKKSYLVEVTDGQSCPASRQNLSPGIIANPVLVVQIGSSMSPLCNIVDGDDASGSFTVEGRSGRGNYSFSLTGADGSFQSGSGDRFTFSGMKPGAYTVYVKDASSCVATIATDVVVPAADPIAIETIVNLDASRDQTMSATLAYALCPDEMTSITVGESNGKFPMSYQLTGTTESGVAFTSSVLTTSSAGQQQTFTNIPAGTYQVRATHAGQCMAVSNDIRLFTIERPIVSVDKTIKVSQSGTDYHVSCKGGSDGKLTLTVDPLTPFGDFTIELFADGVSDGPGITVAGDTPIEFTGLDANSAYTYTVTNSLTPQCIWQYNDPITLNEPDEITISSQDITTARINGFEIDCFGNEVDYQIDFEGGIYPFQLLLRNDLDQTLDAAIIIEGEAQSHVFADLEEGDYHILIRDYFGATCELRSADFELDAPDLLVPAVDMTSSPTCLAGSDGSIQLSATGGNPITGTDYTFEITDYALKAPFNLSGENCTSFNIDLITGSTATFTLPAGSYDFQITDGNGCIKTLVDVVIDIPADPLKITSIIPTEPSCNGANDGELAIAVTGGNPFSGGAYEYRLSGGDLTAERVVRVAGTAIFDNLFSSEGVGTYTLSVMDADGCCLVDGFNYQTDIEITQPSAMQLSLVAAQTSQPICFEGTDGSRLTVEVSGGVGPYTFSTDGVNFSASPLGSQFQLTEIPGGADYLIYVRDSRFAGTQAVCTISESFFLPDGPVLTIETSQNDVFCFGGENGSIAATVNLSGSQTGFDISSVVDQSAFTYEWFWLEESSIVANSKDVSGLKAGTYRLTVQRVGLECVQSAIVVIKQPLAPLNITGIETFDLSCAGRADGSVLLDFSGGNPLANQQIEYALNGEAFQNLSLSRTIRNLSEGSYSIVIKNALGCEAVGAFEINSNQLQVNPVIDRQVSCFGLSDGQLTVETTMALDGFDLPVDLEYSLDGMAYQSNPVFSGLTAGSYQITVRDVSNNLCNGISEEVQITQPEEITVTATLVSQSSCRQADGVANVETNASNPTITWLGVFNSVADADALSAGSYRVLVTDESGCSAETIFTMEDAAEMILNPEVDSNTYCELPRGAAHIDITNGKAPFSIVWDNGIQQKTGQAVDGLTGGLYQISVTDANGCTKTSSIEVENQAPFIIELTESVSTACGEDLGSLSVTATSGFEPYTYYWPTLDVTTQTVSGLSEGSYPVIATDNLGCSVTETFMILPESGEITVETSLSLPVCSSETGVIEVTNVIGGTAPYQLVWKNSNQDIVQNGGNVLSNLSVGTYFVEVLDGEGCRYAQPAIELVSDSSREPSLTVATIEKSYCGAENGSVTVNINEGQSPFNIKLFDPADNLLDEQTVDVLTATFDQLGQGNYQVFLQDAYGCDHSIDFSITDKSLPQINVSDIGSATSEIAVGRFTVNLLDAVGEAFTYQVEDEIGNVENFDTPFVSGLVSGRYIVKATNGTCTTNTVLVEIPENEPIEVSSSIIAATCLSSSDGQIILSITGGIEPYQVVWQDDAGNLIDGSNTLAESLTTGRYHAIITDVIGTQLNYSFEIGSLPELSIEVIDAKNPNCSESCDGAIEVLVTGGSGEYSINWNNGIEGSEISGLCEGSYQVMVTDVNSTNCQIQKTITLSDPEPIAVNLIASRLPTCSGGNDGSLSVAVTGGSELFELEWNNGQTGNVVTGIHAGNYAVLVKDLIGDCQQSFEFDLADQLPIELTESIISPPSCNGVADGKIEIRLANTTNPLITWSNGDVGFMSDGLAAGEHSFSLLDGNGCRFSAIVTMPETPALEVSSISSTPVSCFGTVDGSISLSVTGGTGEKSVSWSLNGNRLAGLANEFNPSVLSAGIYQYQVPDLNECTISGNIEVISPSPLSFDTIEPTPVSCNGGTDGQIDVEVAGGNGDYTYQLNEETVAFPVSDLVAGQYVVSVSDLNGCSISQRVTIEEPAALIVESVSITNVFCDGASDGSIAVTPFGGNGEYRYQWSNGAQTSEITGVVTGTYQVTITDGKGCEISESYLVDTPNPISLVNLIENDPTCFQGSDGQISFEVLGGTAPYTYQWSHSNETTNISSALVAGSYSVTVTDANGCFKAFDFTLEDPIQLFVTTLNESVLTLCSGASVPLDAGLWAAYEWYLNDELISNERIVNADSRGIYRVEVQSEKGCSTSKSVEVLVEENPLSADFVFDTDIFAKDTLVVIDVSWPVPGDIVWTFPEGVTRLTGSDGSFFQELIFDEPGLYTIGLRAIDQGCSDYIEKQFEVLEKSAKQEGIADKSAPIKETSIEETIVSPVPNNGQFELIVKLDQKADVEVSIYGFSNERLLQKQEGKSRLTYQFNIDLGDVIPGVYLVVTRSGKSTKVNKIIVR